jgi:hypothetical protein
MNKRNVRWISFAFGGTVLAALAAVPLTNRSALADDHGHDHNPGIYHAISALHDAEFELKNANRDFHGHKQDALDSIHHAIEELDRIKDW